MDLIENIYYESLPYVYAALAIVGFMCYDISRMAVVAGVVLSFCSYYVFNKRYVHRNGAKPGQRFNI